VRGERDVPRVALEDLAVVQGHHAAAGRADPAGAQRLAPLVEEVAQGVVPLDRRLDVDDAVGGVRVQPVEAGSLLDERARRGRLGLRAGDADGGRHLTRRAVHEDGQVGVDVEQGLLAGLAADAVHGLAGDRGGRAGQRGAGRHRYLLGPEAARGRRLLEGAQRAERRQVQLGGLAAGLGPAPAEGQRDADDSGDDHDGRGRAGQPQPSPSAAGLLRAGTRDPLSCPFLTVSVTFRHDS
jgi:hypothetical protein